MELSRNMSVPPGSVPQTGKGGQVTDRTNTSNPPQTLDHRLPDQHLNQLHHEHERGGDSDRNPPNSKTPLLLQPQPEATALLTKGKCLIQYRECLRNHAASMGRHVVDGCGEFMPGGEEGTPEELKCAACDCHRNFHRKEVEGEPHPHPNFYYPYINCHGSHATSGYLPQVLASFPPLPLQHRYSNTIPTGPVPPVMMNFGFSRGTGAPGESSSEEDFNMFHFNGGAQELEEPPCSASKRRLRTKFTQEQKERMQEFADGLGWKIQKQDGEEVQQFCARVGVKRQVFKVWMQNSKQAMKKKQL